MQWAFMILMVSLLTSGGVLYAACLAGVGPDEKRQFTFKQFRWVIAWFLTTLAGLVILGAIAL